MSLPSYQPKKPPEGPYVFKVSKEPEKRRQRGEQGDFIAVDFFFKIQSPAGDVRDFRESLLPWDDRYRDILLALGGEEDDSGNVHLSEMADIVGQKFNARIKHIPDRNDRTKTWARIADIEIPKTKSIDDDVPPPMNGSDEETWDEEIPF